MVKYIDGVRIANKKVLVRVDFDVSLSSNHTIADDQRIRQNLPTLKYLLRNKNKLICVAKLGRPHKRDPRLSLKVVARRLEKLLPNYQIKLVDDFLNPADRELIAKQTNKQIILLENIRFYKEEKLNDPRFAKQLASLAEAFVSDGFAVAHRAEASVVGVARYLPSYGGLLLKKEVETIAKFLKKPARPLVAIIGGVKIGSKMRLLNKLCQLTDYLLIGGGLANVLLVAQGYELGKADYDYEEVEQAKRLLYHARIKKAKIILPVDAVVGLPDVYDSPGEVRSINDLPLNKYVLDIGPATQALFATYINKAKSIIWNGPMGFFENPSYRNGTDFVYYTVANHQHASSLVGGGDTIAAISKKEYLSKITHLSTGGAAMLEFIEKGTLPGIEALK